MALQRPPCVQGISSSTTSPHVAAHAHPRARPFSCSARPQLRDACLCAASSAAPPSTTAVVRSQVALAGSAADRQPWAASAGLAAAALAAAVVHLSAGAPWVSAAPLYDTLPGFGAPTPFAEAVAAERQLRASGTDIDEVFDENLATEQLRQFVGDVSSGKLKAQDYAAERLKMNFRRGADGRVELRSRQGRWFSVRPDMQVPGFLLMRDSARGDIFVLPPDERDGLSQFDLSDDVVVAELFSNTAWQDVMVPLQVRNNSGATTQLQLKEAEFRNVVSLLEAVDEEGAEPEEAAAAPAAAMAQ